MIAALAALTLLWSPVALDCLGGPESGVVYSMAYLYRECEQGDDPPPCRTFAVRLDTRDTSWSTEIGSDPPPRGAAYFFEVTDRDGAGNWSDSCAP